MVKFLSLIASFLMLFQFAFPREAEVKESGDILKEQRPEYNELRTADEIRGVDGSVFYIERPSEKVKEVNVSEFGMSPENADNYDAFKTALGYCRDNPNTKLKFDDGVYYIDNKTSLVFNGVRNVVLEGGDTTVMFSNVVNAFEIRGCDCLEIRNIRFDWDWDKHPLSDIVVIKNAKPKNNELDLVFLDREADENTIFSALSQCDPETFTYGAKGGTREDYIYQHPECIVSVTKTDKNTLHVKHDGSFKNYGNGETYILRHYVYDTTFMGISSSRNITVNGISLYGYPGSGFVVNNKTSHFQIINSFIGANPEYTETRHTSLGADAIHIVNTDGCFNIENNDISGQGDDALNVHDGLGCADEVNGNEIMLTASAMLVEVGDTLGFRDDKFNATDIKATVIAKETIRYDYFKLTFDKELEGIIGKNYIAFSTAYDSGNYVIRNNYIHENRARGFLLQSSNGLCENNTFYKIDMQAIKIVMDITRGLWYEGTGVDRLVIRNNKFEQCTYGRGGEVINIGTNLDGETAVSQPFTNIEITDNTFCDFTGRVINANNVNGLNFSGNKIDAGKNLRRNAVSARAYFGEYCSNIKFENNEWKHCFAGGTAKAETAAEWARINRIK